MAFCDRQCKKCDTVKPLELFRKRNSCKDGYGYTCKECANEYNRAKLKERYHENHEEELRKKREYVAANRDRINKQAKERMAKKRAAQRIERQKEIPDMYLDYTDNEGQHQSIKLSELTDEQYKSLYWNNITVQLLILIAKRFQIDLNYLSSKDGIIKCLISHGILSENALTKLVPANGKLYKSDTEKQCNYCLLIKSLDNFKENICKDCKQAMDRDRYYTNKLIKEIRSREI